MGFIIYLVMGGVIGWLASIIMKTNAQMGIIWNVLAGILGAVIGSFIANKVFNISFNESLTSVEGFLVALVGAVVLIFLVKLIFKK